jgi:predicted outer membrane protein
MSHPNPWKCLIILPILLAGFAPGHQLEAAEQPTAQTEQQTQIARLMQRVHTISLVQIKAAELALEQSEHSYIQALAERVLRDHRITGKQVTALATELRLELETPALLKPGAEDPTAQAEAPEEPAAAAPDTEQGTDLRTRLRQTLSKLETEVGEQFDRAYVRSMQQSHRWQIQLLQKADQQIDHPAVDDLIATLTPMLEQHIALADRVTKRLDADDSPGGA